MQISCDCCYAVLLLWLFKPMVWKFWKTILQNLNNQSSKFFKESQFQYNQSTTENLRVKKFGRPRLVYESVTNYNLEIFLGHNKTNQSIYVLFWPLVNFYHQVEKVWVLLVQLGHFWGSCTLDIFWLVGPDSNPRCLFSLEAVSSHLGSHKSA